jgi:hypothetical protein
MDNTVTASQWYGNLALPSREHVSYGKEEKNHKIATKAVHEPYGDRWYELVLIGPLEGR